MIAQMASLSSSSSSPAVPVPVLVPVATSTAAAPPSLPPLPATSDVTSVRMYRRPEKMVRDPSGMERWRQSQLYGHLGTFLMKINTVIKGTSQSTPRTLSPVCMHSCTHALIITYFITSSLSLQYDWYDGYGCDNNRLACVVNTR